MLATVPPFEILILIFSLYPVIWLISYVLTTRFESKNPSGALNQSFAYLHTPIILLIYLIFLGSAIEELLVVANLTIEQFILAKLVAGFLITVSLYRGVIPYDFWGPTLIIGLYISLPFTGRLFSMGQSPVYVFTTFWHIIIYMLLWLRWFLEKGKPQRGIMGVRR